MLALSKGPNRTRIFLISPNDGNRSRLPTDVFYSYLRRIPDNGQTLETQQFC
jgi:hypothetical protein